MALVSRSFGHRFSPVKVKLIKPESLAQVSLMDNENKVENYPGINFSLIREALCISRQHQRMLPPHRPLTEQSAFRSGGRLWLMPGGIDS